MTTEPAREHRQAAMTPFDLTGRVALVTGAGSAYGIGHATARTLAGLGASVVVSSTTERIHDRAAELPAGTVALVGDLTLPETADVLVETALDRHGRLDAVVNCAGMTSVARPDPEAGHIEELDPETWRAALARNLDSAFFLARAAVPALVASGAGRLVMVSSLTGPVMAMRGEVAYAAAKAGLVGLVRGLAVDLADRGVTVNAIAPGWIATGSQTESERRQGEVTPAGRSGTPYEVAGLAAYLCTREAGYLTGQCVVVDGGNSIAEERACAPSPGQET
jgi:3-oxoacyl-[acyl-carrier protein] reductase